MVELTSYMCAFSSIRLAFIEHLLCSCDFPGMQIPRWRLHLHVCACSILYNLGTRKSNGVLIAMALHLLRWEGGTGLAHIT